MINLNSRFRLNNNKSVPSVTNPVRRKISTMSPSITTNNTNIINKVENRRLFRSISEDQYQNLHIGVLNVPAPQVNGRDPIRSQEALRRRKSSTPRGTFAPETIQELVIIIIHSKSNNYLKRTRSLSSILN